MTDEERKILEEIGVYSFIKRTPNYRKLVKDVTKQEENGVNEIVSRAIRETEFEMLSKYQGAFYLLLAALESKGISDLEFQKIKFELHLLQLKRDKDYVDKWHKEILKDQTTFPLGLIAGE